MDIETIKRLKDLTGVGLTDAKQALLEAKGDFDAALAAMRKKGLTKADKRGEREARSGVVWTYNHDNRIGVVLEVNCETDFVAKNELFTNFVKDIAMHIAASNPEFVSDSDITEAEKKKVEAEFTDKAEQDGSTGQRTEKMIAGIVSGMLKKHFSGKCLLDQPFIKNPDQTVGQYLKEHIAKLGENIVIRRFERLALGEVN